MDSMMLGAMRREIERIVGEAVGAGSVCWDPLPTSQVFNSNEANKVVDHAMEELQKLKLSAAYCKRCDKVHAPICNRCGKMDGDFRSMHGPCGRCAFPNGVGGLKKVAKKLTTKARNRLDTGAFVFPKDRRYPIHDEAHARNALARASGKPEEAQVRAAVHSRFPGIGKEASIEDAAEQAHNVLINTHFFLKDNRDGMHPAHAKRVKDLEQGMRTLVKEIDQYAPRTAHTYADGHAENCKTAGFAEFARRNLDIRKTPGNIVNTVKGFRNPIKSMKAGWHADNGFGKAMTVGFAALDAKDALKKEDPSGQGRGRGQRIGAAIGNTAGGLIGLRHGTMSGGLVGSAVGSFIGGRVGRIADGTAKVVRRPAAPQPVTPQPVRPLEVR